MININYKLYIKNINYKYKFLVKTQTKTGGIQIYAYLHMICFA